VIALKEILKNAGVDEDRVWLRWVSASEGGRFAETVTEMVAFLKEKGPNPKRREWAV
jgi:F420-non-reducing hydrogenase iron-sulfur subunit